MLVIVQFPLADLRPFLDEDARVPVATEFARLDLSNTVDFGGSHPAPFLPGTGALRKRRQGAQMAGETLYFQAHGALRFAPDLRRIPGGAHGEPGATVQVFFRRFQAFQEQHQLARFELGLLLTLDEGTAPLDASAVAALLRRCLELPVSVPGQTMPVPLARAGPPLAAHVLRASTRRQAQPAPTWSVSARQPLVLVEYGATELGGVASAAAGAVAPGSERSAAMPLPGARPVPLPEAPGLQLHVASLPLGGGAAWPVWSLATGVYRVDLAWFSDTIAVQHREAARLLRLNLMRHHAEREVLAATLDNVLLPGRLMIGQPRSLPAARLDAYLLRAAARLTREQRFGYGQSAIAQALSGVEAAALAVDVAAEGRYHDLWEHLAGVLDVNRFTALYEALPRLPMGSAIEAASLRKVLEDRRSPPRRIAVSYAHADTRLMESFRSHLAEAEQRGLVQAWDDRWIVAGTDWRAGIDQRFDEADIVVALLSPDFLASHYCMQVEMPYALARARSGQAALVPVVVRSCTWEPTPLAERQVVRPHGKPVQVCGNRAEAWRIVVHELLAAGQGLPASWQAAL